MNKLKNSVKISICSRHGGKHTVPVCPHLYEAIITNKKQEPIFPIFYEKFITRKYYEKLWFCLVCAKKYNISSKGVLLYDEHLRRLEKLSEDEIMRLQYEDYQIHDPFLSAKDSVKGVCYDCFKEQYSSQADKFEENISMMEKVSINIK